MILNVYKEKGWTSFDVVAKIRGMLGKKEKVGHAGTLDPLAEGVLVVLTGEDTKKQREFTGMDKEYIAEIAFGVTTPTYDLEVLPALSEKQPSLKKVEQGLKEILSRYQGEIDQKVPVYSAVKVGGKTLYKEARKGRGGKIKLPVKRINIYEIEILDSLEEDIETKAGIRRLPVIKMRVSCSAGSYIRSLAHDFGEELGFGAVLVSLLRTRIGDFSVDNAKKVPDLSLGI